MLVSHTFYFSYSCPWLLQWQFVIKHSSIIARLRPFKPVTCYMVDATVITFSFDSVGNNAEWIDFAVLRPVIDVDKTRGTGANEPIIWPDWHPRGRLDITSYDWIICTTWYTTLSPVYHFGVMNTVWTKYTANPDSGNCVSPSSRESVCFYFEFS